MDLEHFYRFCYLETGGWIPAFPPTQTLQLGDFCQINQAKLRPLGNILNFDLVEEVLVSDSLPLDKDDWKIKSGVRQLFCATELVTGEGGSCSEWTKQLLEFEQQGSFLFYGLEPYCQMLLNWSQIQDDVTLKLTQRDYAFREVYVITALAKMDNWGFASANQPTAELEVLAQTKRREWYELISHETCRIEQSKGIDNIARENELPAYFFKAKRLVISDQKREQFLRDIVLEQALMTPQALSNWLREDLTNRFDATEINLANGLSFFDWVDTNLDDVAKLC